MSKDKDTRSDALDPTGVEPKPEPRENEPANRTEKTAARRGSSDARDATKIKPTRISGTWVAVIVAVIVLVFLLIFILQNSGPVTVHYLGVSGTLPLGVALLFASVGGAVLVALVGVARIFQLRRFARRAGNREQAE